MQQITHFGYGSYLYDENTSPYTHDTDKAISILQDNGWEYKSGAWQKKIGYNTVRLKLNLVVQSENASRKSVAEIIEKNLEEIGIPVTITAVRNQTFENYLTNKNYDIILTRSDSTE